MQNPFTWKLTLFILTRLATGLFGRRLFEAATNLTSPMSKLSILKEFWHFLKVRKKWWLAPIVLFLLVLGVLLVAAKGSVLAPFIYSLF